MLFRKPGRNLLEKGGSSIVGLLCFSFWGVIWGVPASFLYEGPFLGGLPWGVPTWRSIAGGVTFISNASLPGWNISRLGGRVKNAD